MTKHLHFTEDELAGRRAKATAELTSHGLDALLIFRQESMYYLTGYDTFGYVHFQTLILTAEGDMVLLTRSADLRQAGFTSVIGDIRIWKDGADANPAEDLKSILAGLGLEGKRLGVEYDAYGLTAANGKRVEAAMEGFAELTDASGIVTKLRLVKSPAEISYVRKAAELADAAWDKALEITGPGVDEGEILAAMHSEIFSRGGDDPANEFIIGSGPGALMCRYFTGRRKLGAQDYLTLEFAGTYRHYHACLFRTIRIGERSERQNTLYAVSLDALQACEAALRPGQTAGDVFGAYAHTLDKAGLNSCRLNACGYSLGTTFAPSWMDWPMLYQGNAQVLEPGMVFFLHMIIFDDEKGIPATVGQTYLVTENSAESLSKADLALPLL